MMTQLSDVVVLNDFSVEIFQFARLLARLVVALTNALVS
jgi:hypothetical protein